MSYKELYDFAQGLDVPVDIALIRRKIREILPDKKVKVVKTGIERDFMQGCYIAPHSEDTLFYSVPPGVAVIALYRELNECWARFVQAKELMHLFDSPLARTSTGEDFETLLQEFSGAIEPGVRSPQMASEIDCLWMAIGIMCPEELRAELQELHATKALSNLEIAQRLKVPEKYVGHFFRPRYKQIISGLIE